MLSYFATTGILTSPTLWASLTVGAVPLYLSFRRLRTPSDDLRNYAIDGARHRMALAPAATVVILPLLLEPSKHTELLFATASCSLVLSLSMLYEHSLEVVTARLAAFAFVTSTSIWPLLWYALIWPMWKGYSCTIKPGWTNVLG